VTRRESAQLFPAARQSDSSSLANLYERDTVDRRDARGRVLKFNRRVGVGPTLRVFGISPPWMVDLRRLLMSSTRCGSCGRFLSAPEAMPSHNSCRATDLDFRKDCLHLNQHVRAAATCRLILGRGNHTAKTAELVSMRLMRFAIFARSIESRRCALARSLRTLPSESSDIVFGRELC